MIGLFIKSAEEFYRLGEGQLRRYHERAHDCSKTVGSSMIPPANGLLAEYNIANTSESSMGALCLESLIGKLTTGLFPSIPSIFSLEIQHEEKLKSENPSQQEMEEEEARKRQLLDLEIDATRLLQSSAVWFERANILEACAVGGSCLVYADLKANVCRIYVVGQYVQRRSRDGAYYRAVIRHKVYTDTLDKSWLPEGMEPDGNTTVDVYIDIKIHLVSGKCSESTYCGIPGALKLVDSAEYSKHTSPWLPQEWKKTPEEDYSRGHIEKMMLHLKAVGTSTLAEHSLKEMIARYNGIGINPDGTGDAKTLLELVNKGKKIFPGKKEDFQAIHFAELGQILPMIAPNQSMVRELYAWFLYYPGLIRNAERVTQEEVLQIRQELMGLLSATFINLEKSLQLPLCIRALQQVAPEVNLEGMNIIALGGTTQTARMSESQGAERIIGILASLSQIPPEMMDYLNLPGTLTILAKGAGVDPDDILDTFENISQKRAQRQKAELLNKLATSGGSNESISER